MLLNLASLCHPNRHTLWVDNAPSAIYALDELGVLAGGATPRTASSATAQHRYCWVVWKSARVGRDI